MRKAMFCSVLMILSVVGYSQSTVILSTKHQDKLDKISDPYKRAQQYAKYHLKDSLKQAKQRLKQFSAQPKKKQSALQQKLDSVASGTKKKIHQKQVTLSSKLDKGSLQEMSKAPQAKVDSLTHKISTAVNTGVSSAEAKVKDKLMIGSVENIATDHVPTTSTSDKMTNGLKTTELSKNIPDVSIGSTSLDEIDLSLRDLPSEGLGEVGVLPKIEGLQNIDSTFIQGKVKDLGSSAGVDTYTVEEQIEEVAGLKKEVAENTKALKEFKDKDIRNIETDDLEAAAQNIEEVAELNAQTTALKKGQEEYKKQLERYQSLDYIKEQVNDKQMELGVDHFADKADKLSTAKENLNKLKKKYGTLESTKNLPVVKRNQMRGKSLMELMYAGLLIQLHTDPNKAIDLSPFVGYKISGVWRAGLGYTYRVRLDKHGVPTNLASNETYGVRLFTELDVYKGIFGHVSYEQMRTGIRHDIASQDILERAWVKDFYIGGGSSFKIKKLINGYMMTLYNVNYDLLKSPSSTKIVIRVGIMFKK